MRNRRRHASIRRSSTASPTPVLRTKASNRYGASHRHARAQVLANTDRCAYCKRLISDALPRGHELKATVDHIIPISQGGEHTVTNLLPCCSKCNSQRGAKDPGTWNTPDAPGAEEW